MNLITELLGQRYSDLKTSYVFGLNFPEVEKIGDQSYLSLPEHGISLVMHDNERIGTIQLHATGHEGFSKFVLQVPYNIEFAMKRAEVRKKLGAPTTYGEKQLIPVLGEAPAWDSYVFEGTRVHIEYTLQDQSVQLISLSAT